ncbi:MAG: hypothetical protein II536_01900, partial [Clostridia bacterium]|nr:hypothetical protein [Clostridia bacterium]
EVYSSLFLGMVTGALLNAEFNMVEGLNQLTCRFCGSRYVFNKEELTSLLDYASSGGAEDANR